MPSAQVQWVLTLDSGVTVNTTVTGKNIAHPTKDGPKSLALNYEYDADFILKYDVFSRVELQGCVLTC